MCVALSCYSINKKKVSSYEMFWTFGLRMFVILVTGFHFSQQMQAFKIHKIYIKKSVLMSDVSLTVFYYLFRFAYGVQ